MERPLLPAAASALAAAARPSVVVTASTPEMGISPPPTASGSGYFAAHQDASTSNSTTTVDPAQGGPVRDLTDAHPRVASAASSEASVSGASKADAASSSSVGSSQASAAPPPPGPEPGPNEPTASSSSSASSTLANPSTRPRELSKPALNRPPSLAELTSAMRQDPKRWEKLKTEMDQARAADEAANAAASSTSTATNPATPGRLRLQLSSLQRTGDSRGNSPISGPSGGFPLPSIASTVGTPPIPDASTKRPGALGKGVGRMPSLADIQQRVMSRTKSSDGTVPVIGSGEGKKLENLEEGHEGGSPKPVEAANGAVHAPPPSNGSIETASNASSSTSKPASANGVSDAVSPTSTSAPLPAAGPAPKTALKGPLHPLQHPWTLFFDSKATAAAGKRIISSSSAPGGDSSQPATPTVPMTPGGTALGVGGQVYQAALQTIGTFTTVEDFCRYFNWTKRPSQLEMHSSVQIFKDGIKPMWEDPANANGGKWTLTIRTPNTSTLDRLWTYLVLALVGEEVDLHDDVCGAVVATRPRGNRLQIWVRDKTNVERVNGLGKRIIKLLEITEESGVAVDFSPHTGMSLSGSNKFISIVGNPPPTSRPGMPVHAFTTNSIATSPMRSTSSPLNANNPPTVVPFPPSLESIVSPRRSSVGVDLLNLRRPSVEQLAAIQQQQRRASVEIATTLGMSRPPLLVHHSHMGVSVPPGMQAVIVPGPPPPGQPGGGLTGTWRPGLMGVGAPPGLPTPFGSAPKRANSFAGPSTSGYTLVAIPSHSGSRGPSPTPSPQSRKISLPAGPPPVGLGIDTSAGP